MPHERFIQQRLARGWTLEDALSAPKLSKVRHGHSHTQGKGKHSPTYTSWRGIKDRCRCPSNPQYRHYGGRGISVCDRWSSFENFLADMGPRPKGTSLDRIDVNGNYCPENCRWATRTVQAQNKRTSHVLSFNGKTQTISEWSKDTGINSQTISFRLRSGWSVERALNTPPKEHW